MTSLERKLKWLNRLILFANWLSRMGLKGMLAANRWSHRLEKRSRQLQEAQFHADRNRLIRGSS